MPTFGIVMVNLDDMRDEDAFFLHRKLHIPVIRAYMGEYPPVDITEGSTHYCHKLR